MLAMHILHPSQLHWLWRNKRSPSFGTKSSLVLVGAGLPERFELPWTSQQKQFCLVTGTPNPHTQYHATPNSNSLGEASSSALELAAALFSPGLRSDGPDAGGSKEQWQRLIEWAASKGLILPVDYPAPVRSETAEHDVRYDESNGRWFKYTIPGHCGFTVDLDNAGNAQLRMAYPAEYFRRLQLQNQVFADDLHLVGLVNDLSGGGWRIVTSQPDVIGEPPSRMQILEGMLGYGFRPLSDRGPNNALAFRRGNLIVWDSHPGNFVMTPTGVLAPIDLIITEHPEEVDR